MSAITKTAHGNIQAKVGVESIETKLPTNALPLTHIRYNWVRAGLHNTFAAFEFLEEHSRTSNRTGNPLWPRLFSQVLAGVLFPCSVGSVCLFHIALQRATDGSSLCAVHFPDFNRFE